MPDSNITKKALAQAMKDLMAQLPFGKISVGDICRACGMNRKSFYYHFKDKYDLVNWIFYTEFIESVRGAEFPSGWDFLTSMCGYFYRERAFYRCAMEIEGQNSFREYFYEVMSPFLAAFAEDMFTSTEDKRFYITFLGDALLASLVRWLSEGIQTTAEEYVQVLRRVLTTLARHIRAQDG